MNKRWLILVFLVLGLILRTIRLDSRPFGFTWDEAALGYNAYSLLKTGRDEYGQLAPLIFKSFGDYKPGLYIYFTVPVIRALGLNEFATRLPSAIFGTLLLPVLFVFAKLLFPNNKMSIEYWVMSIAAFNPWLIHFSRGAWEANLSLLLTTLGVVLFLQNVKRQSVFNYFLSSGFFGLTFLAYQSAKLFTPLLLFSLFVIYYRKIQFSRLLPSLLLLLLLLLPIVINFTGQSGRLKVFSVFSYTRTAEYVREILRQDNTAAKNYIYYLYHSELLDQAKGVLQRYLNHFSPRFLFMDGDWTSLRLSTYRQGYFTLAEIIPLLLGIFWLFRYLNNSGTKVLIMWIILAPLPAALSRDLVSGVRSLALAVPLTIIVALGISQIVKRRLLLTVIFTGWLFLFALYLEMYYFHSQYYSASQWVSPYKSAFQLIKQYQNNYSRIYFTNKLGQPYIFALFYLQFDPRVYQHQAVLLANRSGDVGQVAGFDKFVFRPVFWPELRGKTNSLFVGDEYELPEKDLNFPGLVKIGDIYYPDGKLALKLVGIP